MLINQCFDETLKKYGITGAVLSRHIGISPSHVSQFRNGKGSAVSHTILEQMLQAMEELAPGSRFYFCLLLAGKNPAEFMAGHSNIDLHSLVALATPAQKAEILVMIASWVSSSKEEPRHSAQELKLAS
ncbi:hypothetical protein DSM106972_038780 [Dulcicalothrix desertica PCC 7102]|uniref:HTH cro/C1-type domain-containing protein n=1 Tax=Dulcicalothrix desertica PCC 7102 TaxID=232991 RepID=A0A3S5K366_9CYAN|nr:helix-turn-helix domain-containing protein [Dulcicalothrix desertica]RUT05057.1 hypothetical protein DSM106972_038780 [Dulcicalothrix desertica PCC 7102]TWH62598.1 DNA-binding Xre family transcriptional regulator [Dulcicalothrix desertica PCC 7102]